MEVTVIIATYGDETWRELAASRALPSVELALPDGPGLECILEHGESLASARNAAAARAEHEWLCFLDADDELAPGYLDAMATAEHAGPVLLAPAIQYVHPTYEDDPVVLDDRHISTMNPCVVGTLVRRDMFLGAGGFADWPIYEDWALWLACWRAGADIVHVPRAIYRAHVRPDSRNEQDVSIRRRTYRDIRRHFQL